MTTQPIQRYKSLLLVTQHPGAHATASSVMDRADDGDYVRYSDYLGAIADLSAENIRLRAGEYHRDVMPIVAEISRVTEERDALKKEIAEYAKQSDDDDAAFSGMVRIRAALAQRLADAEKLLAHAAARIGLWTAIAYDHDIAWQEECGVTKAITAFLAAAGEGGKT